MSERNNFAQNFENMAEWMQRTELMVGEAGINKLKNATVLIVGLGGVGGMAAEMICRAGVGKITIIDRDTVGLTNLNRQIVALQSTLNRAKADVLSERLLQINPDLQLKVIPEWLDESNTKQILDEAEYDFVVDAIDTLSPKVFLIKECVERGIKIVSSMGSGGKMDPSKIKMSDISESNYCALARAVRKRLTKYGITKGLPVVFSVEPVDKSVVILTEDEQYKRSTTGTISYMPAIFGCYIASHVVREIVSN